MLSFDFDILTACLRAGLALVAITLLSSCQNSEPTELTIVHHGQLSAQLFKLVTDTDRIQATRLQVRILEVPQAHLAINAFLSGRADAIIAPIPVAIRSAYQQSQFGELVLMLAKTDQQYSLVSHKDSKTPASFKGKTFGVDLDDNDALVLIERYLTLSTQDMFGDSEPRDIALKVVPRRTQAIQLEQGKIDGFVFDMHSYIRAARNTQQTLIPKSLLSQYQSALVIRQELLTTKPQLRTQVLQAWDSGIQLLDDNPDQALALISEHVRQTPRELTDQLSSIQFLASSDQPDLQNLSSTVNEAILAVCRGLRTLHSLAC